jgi:ABC-type Na+ transport system ATPase subunit NatA
VVVAKNVFKKYDSFVAVKGVTFGVRQGECFGLLGNCTSAKYLHSYIFFQQVLMGQERRHC